MSKVKVSICCITYNQEKYIKEALDSFISQKTNFTYEIIVHDDASTDNTPNIIKEYHKKYPDIIVPIIQKENIYSKNPNSILEILFSKAQGEYIALCDGDDGFIDHDKIRLQVEYMEKHKKVTMCSHNTKEVSDNGDYIGDMVPYTKTKITIEDFFENNSSMHTSSMLFRKKDVEKLPDYFYIATVGDLPLKLHLLSIGSGYHINRIMSYYRTNAIGSWTIIQRNNPEKLRKNHQMEIDVYKMFNKKTNYKYKTLVENRILTKEFEYYKRINNLKEIKKKKYKELYKMLSTKEKIKLYVKSIPGVHKIYTKIKYGNR